MKVNFCCENFEKEKKKKKEIRTTQNQYDLWSKIGQIMEIRLLGAMTRYFVLVQ